MGGHHAKARRVSKGLILSLLSATHFPHAYSSGAACEHDNRPLFSTEPRYFGYNRQVNRLNESEVR